MLIIVLRSKSNNRFEIYLRSISTRKITDITEELYWCVKSTTPLEGVAWTPTLRKSRASLTWHSEVSPVKQGTLLHGASMESKRITTQKIWTRGLIWIPDPGSICSAYKEPEFRSIPGAPRRYCYCRPASLKRYYHGTSAPECWTFGLTGFGPAS